MRQILIALALAALSACAVAPVAPPKAPPNKGPLPLPPAEAAGMVGIPRLDGRTAVIATHRVPILQLATRTMILSHGRMAVDGPRDQVLAHLRKGAA